jgi:predicted Ser/Thr protein kinase
MKNLRSTDPASIDQWKLLGRLGEGGQGVVYLGTDGESKAAIKVFKEVDTKFLGKELEAIAQVSGSAGTATILGTGVFDGLSYVVTTFIDGPDLYSSVTAEGPLERASLMRLAVSTCTSLAAIHRARVVHRDFKPSNVLLGPDGPVVIDFGVAHVIESAGTTSNVVGTPAYAAPEQLAGHKAAPPADLFAWASTMCFAATGIPAFGSDSIPAVMHRIMYAEPQLAGVPLPLREALSVCLRKDPATRPSAEDVIGFLLSAAHNLQAVKEDDVMAAAHTFIHTKVVPYRQKKAWWRGKSYLAGAAMVAACMLIAAVAVSVQSAPDRSASAAPAPVPTVPATSPAAAVVQGPAASPSDSTPRTAADYSTRIMDAIGQKHSALYTHEFDVSQGNGVSKSDGTLYYNPGGATDYQASVTFNDPYSANAPNTSTEGVTIIGNTAYTATAGSAATYIPQDVSPGVDPQKMSIPVFTAVQARWTSSPYNIQGLLAKATDFSVSTVAGQIALNGSLPTTSMLNGPTSGLFDEMKTAKTTTFTIVIGTDFLPARVEMSFRDVPGFNFPQLAKAIATYQSWGQTGQITAP